jgi:hypothetical protein
VWQGHRLRAAEPLPCCGPAPALTARIAAKFRGDIFHGRAHRAATRLGFSHLHLAELLSGCDIIGQQPDEYCPVHGLHPSRAAVIDLPPSGIAALFSGVREFWRPCHGRGVAAWLAMGAPIWAAAYTVMTVAVFLLAAHDETPVWATTSIGVVSGAVCLHLWLLCFGVHLWRDVVGKLLGLSDAP